MQLITQDIIQRAGYEERAGSRERNARGGSSMYSERDMRGGAARHSERAKHSDARSLGGRAKSGKRQTRIGRTWVSGRNWRRAAVALVLALAVSAWSGAAVAQGGASLALLAQGQANGGGAIGRAPYADEVFIDGSTTNEEFEALLNDGSVRYITLTEDVAFTQRFAHIKRDSGYENVSINGQGMYSLDFTGAASPTGDGMAPDVWMDDHSGMDSITFASVAIRSSAPGGFLGVGGRADGEGADTVTVYFYSIEFEGSGLAAANINEGKYWNSNGIVYIRDSDIRLSPSSEAVPVGKDACAAAANTQATCAATSATAAACAATATAPVTAAAERPTVFLVDSHNYSVYFEGDDYVRIDGNPDAPRQGVYAIWLQGRLGHALISDGSKLVLENNAIPGKTGQSRSGLLYVGGGPQNDHDLILDNRAELAFSTKGGTVMGGWMPRTFTMVYNSTASFLVDGPQRRRHDLCGEGMGAYFGARMFTLQSRASFQLDVRGDASSRNEAVLATATLLVGDDAQMAVRALGRSDSGKGVDLVRLVDGEARDLKPQVILDRPAYVLWYNGSRGGDANAFDVYSDGAGDADGADGHGLRAPRDFPFEFTGVGVTAWDSGGGVVGLGADGFSPEPFNDARTRAWGVAAGQGVAPGLGGAIGQGGTPGQGTAIGQGVAQGQGVAIGQGGTPGQGGASGPKAFSRGRRPSWLSTA